MPHVCSYTFYIPTKLVAPILEEEAATAAIRWEPEGNINEWGGLRSNVRVTFFLHLPPPPFLSLFFKLVLLQGCLLRNIFLFCLFLPSPLSMPFVLNLQCVSLLLLFSPCLSSSLSVPETKNCYSSLLFFPPPPPSVSHNRRLSLCLPGRVLEYQ